MNTSLNNRHVVITGAGRGIGAAIARTLAQAGARLTLLGRTLPPLQQTAQALHTPTHVQTVDVSIEADVNHAIAQAVALFGPVHVLVNNAGQASSPTDDVLALGDLSAKFNSFGFETIEIDGHNEEDIDQAIKHLWKTGHGKPKALIARTVKGKGVHFMESDNRWHYTRLNAQTFAEAMTALGPEGDLK